MKLSKIEQLIILVLFIIACVFFIGNTCKNENYTTKTYKCIIEQIETNIKNNYNIFNQNTSLNNNYRDVNTYTNNIKEYNYYVKNTRPLFNELLYYNILNKLNNNMLGNLKFISYNKNNNTYNFIDNNNINYTCNIYIYPQQIFHGIPLGNGEFVIHVNSNIKKLEFNKYDKQTKNNINSNINMLQEELKNISSIIQHKLQNELTTIVINNFVSY